MRHMFGGTPASYAMEKVGNQLTLRPSAVGTVWDSLTGGTQLTDLTDTIGTAITAVTADSDGAVAFYGPDGVTNCYIDFGYGRRYAMPANDVGSVLATFMGQGGQAGGWATLDSTSRIPAAQMPTQAGRIGVYLPVGWDTNWLAKRATAGSSPARIVVAGDSLSQGYFASNLHTTSWVGLTRQTLQTAYGNGGSGFFSISRSSAVMSADPAALSAWAANGSNATLTGTWTLGGLNFGPGITYITASAAATATFQVTGTTLKIYNISGAAPRAAFTYKIDGGAPVTVTVPTGSTAIQTTTVTGLSSGTHTVVITWAGAASDVLYLVGVAGENSTGVIVDNLARAGTRTSHWYTANALNSPWNGGTSYPADLVICSLGLNDAANSVTGADYVTNLTGYLQAVRAAHNGATDIMLILMHLGNYGGATAAGFYGQYASQIRSIAESYGAALVNFWAIGHNSWDYWNSLGYFGNGTNPGPAGTDLVHASDAGHAYIASQITPLLTG